jgi:hypothetical protein
MGLDMYLEVETYISRPMEWNTEEARLELTPNWEKVLSVLPGTPSEDSYGVNIIYTVAYWRKANAIHRWFVDNVQDGVDECQRSYVEIEKLNELLAVCHQVIKAANLIDGHVYNGSRSGPDTNGEWVDDYVEGKVIEKPEVVEKLLPTEGGFFFGSTAYDEYYLRDVQNTINQIESVLAEYQDKSVDFYYRASW